MHSQPSPELAGTALGRDAQALLKSCVHCGFCLPACPTYRVTGNELDSPRGRIYLIKQLVEGAAATEATRDHLDRCLTCRSCETACPSGVQYGRLVDIGRELIETRAPRATVERSWRSALAVVLSQRSLVTPLLRVAQSVRGVLPATLRSKVPPRVATGSKPAARHSRRVVMLEGCVQPGLAPQINAATARVLDRAGITTLTARGESCCGALGHHLGHTERALVQARSNVDLCIRLLDDGAEAIVSTASGCGVFVKDYGHLLRDDPTYAAKAARVSAATRDLCEVITVEDLRTAGITDAVTRGAVAWQAPCTLQHGQKDATAGRVERLLRAAGYSLTAIASPHLCCGSAGTYSILQPELSQQVRARKLDTLLGGKPETIATANIGCLEHLRAASPVPVKHWIELIDAALGAGPGQ
jgi:glycolate oxidase iron-sulfur subunit